MRLLSTQGAEEAETHRRLEELSARLDALREDDHSTEARALLQERNRLLERLARFGSARESMVPEEAAALSPAEQAALCGLEEALHQQFDHLLTPQTPREVRRPSVAGWQARMRTGTIRAGRFTRYPVARVQMRNLLEMGE